MNLECNLEAEDVLELSDIPVSSEIKEGKDLRENANRHLQNSREQQEDLEDKNTPSTNFGSDLEPIPAERNITVKQRNMLLGLSDNSLNLGSADQSLSRSNLKDSILELLKEAELLENNQLAMHSKFASDAETLRQALQARLKRNMQMKSQLDSLRRDLLECRQEMRTLIQLLKNAHHSKQSEQNQQPRQLLTLRHYQSQKNLHLAERQSHKAPTSEDRKQKNIKTLHARRLYIRDKSDNGKQIRNY